MMFIFFIYTLW